MEAVAQIVKMRGEITAFAKGLGFDLVGFSRTQLEEKYTKALREWLAAKFEGELEYMRETSRLEKRLDVTKLLPGAQTVIVVAMNYFRPQPPLKRGHGRVARYAYGRDYHKIIGSKLRKLAHFVRSLGGAARHFVDVGPVLERAYSEQSGIGVIGKNSCLITKEYGSWVLLGEVITTLELTYSDALKTARKNFSACGECTRCMHACPTGAIVAPGVIDASRCLSYLTIEHKGYIPRRFARTIAKTKKLFGCDICQEVCPHNISRQQTSCHDEFSTPAIATDSLYLQKILAIGNEARFHKLLAGSALKRAKRGGLKRTARILSPRRVV